MKKVLLFLALLLSVLKAAAQDEKIYLMPTYNGDSVSMKGTSLTPHIMQFSSISAPQMDYFILDTNYVVSVVESDLTLYKWIAGGYGGELALVEMSNADEQFFWCPDIKLADVDNELGIDYPRGKYFQYSEFFQLDENEPDVWLSVDIKEDKRIIRILYEGSWVDFSYKTR